MPKASTSHKVIHRQSPLAELAVQGRFGADHGTPGVMLTVVHPVSLVMVVARKGKGRALATALETLKSVTVAWAGPEQYFVSAQGLAEGALVRSVTTKLGDLSAVTDQSHGRVFMRVTGPKARALLTKGTPVDLHPSEFPIGKSALTQMAHVGVHLTRSGEDEFLLAVFRAFSESFWEWLTLQAEEFGYQVI
jgi:methylglutamate dehydrogenase subunit D